MSDDPPPPERRANRNDGPEIQYVRDRRAGPPEHPADKPCETFLKAIGIDPTADVKKIRETLRWADEEQAEKLKRAVEKALDAREKRSRNYAFIYGTAATVVSIIATALWTHFIGGSH